MSSLLALGSAARAGTVDQALGVLLDEIESLGGLGPPTRHEFVRAEIIRVARAAATTWATHPELAAADLYARTLALPGFDRIRRRWAAALDARGPWLQAQRATVSERALVAVLRDQEAWWHAEGPMARFVSEDELELELPRHEQEPRRLTWTWARAEVVERPERGPMPSPAADPRLEKGERVPHFRPHRLRPARQLAWPERSQAEALVSRDGHSLYVYGPGRQLESGLLRILDLRTWRLVCIEELEFDTPVTRVLEGPAGELLISTFERTQIRGRAHPWVLEGHAWRLAWSPSGRYLCTLAEGLVEVWDTQVPAIRGLARRHGSLLRFGVDGAQFVDGDELIDVRRGVALATLAPQFSNYLMGGPRETWLHVGTELIALTHGGLQLWDARTGAAVEPGLGPQDIDQLVKAFNRSGRALASADFWGQRIELLELPSCATLATLAVGLQVCLLALSSKAELIAVASQEGLEVWTRAGERRHRAEIAIELFGDQRFSFVIGELLFSADDRELEYRGTERTLRWSLDRELLTPPAVSPAHTPLPGWSLEGGPVSTFVDGEGRRIEVADSGPWIGHPEDARVVACPGGLYRLRGV